MQGLIKKISKIDLSNFLYNGKIFARDFEIIRSYLFVPKTKIRTSGEIHEFIIDALKKIADKSFVKIKLYGSNQRNKYEWFDLINNNSVTARDAHYIAKNFSEIFKEQVSIHKYYFPKDKNMQTFRKAFLSFRVHQEYYYILYLNLWRYQEYYNHVFYSAILNLLNLFHEEQERQKILHRLESLENILAERERSLQIAERAVKRKVYDLHNLVEASNEIYSILDFKQLINSALLTIIGQIGTQSAFALMYDSSNHAYDRCFQKGYKEKEIQNLKFKIESPIARFFLMHETPLFLKDLVNEDGFARFVKKLNKLKVSIVAPIIHSERLQGIIAIGEKLYGRNFTQTDFELFHVLVNIISISIGNALNYEEVKNLSLTDGMTGLHNYRYFAIRLKEELNRARRNNTNVS